MRIPKYLSPTSVSTFAQNPEEYYSRYLADHRPPRDPQTKPMSVGSAFDAYVKDYLVKRIFGAGAKPEFEFEAQFGSQVEDHNKDWAKQAGLHCMEVYKSLGALADLCAMLDTSINEPRFEADVYGNITVDGYTIRYRGKPDCFFVNDRGMRIILDWKVNGYCSNSPPSPMQGFVLLRTSGKFPKTHDKCDRKLDSGIWINGSHPLNLFNESWARQTTIYGWLGGVPVGEDFISVIHQLVCKKTATKPKIRVAEHASRISADWQKAVFAESKTVWEAIESGHFFPHLTPDESKAKQDLLDRQSLALWGPDNTPDDDLFAKMTRS